MIRSCQNQCVPVSRASSCPVHNIQQCTHRMRASIDRPYQEYHEPPRQISAEEQRFPFKQACQDMDGVIESHNAFDEGDPFAGTLAQCSLPGDFGVPETIVLSQIDDIKAQITSGKLRPINEKERLVVYFLIVYPLSDPNRWWRMSLVELQHYYQSLEFYYKLPREIMPRTKITPRRAENHQFYRVPAGVVLDQDENRQGETQGYIEVARFGPTYAALRDPTLFNGTYYYPVRGSGMYIPLGRSLLAYNKVHALKQLGVHNSEIVMFGGRDFQSFLKQDSDAAWKKIVAKKPDAKKEDYWVTVCAVSKRAANSDEGCPTKFGALTVKVSYIPAALDAIINEMVSGKSLRMSQRKRADGTMKDTKVYYGASDTIDRFLAQLVRDRGYDTIQLLREAQMSLDGDAVVGNEIIKLVEPMWAQAEYVQLDPFATPLQLPYSAHSEASVQYLLDATVNAVNPVFVAKSLYTPFGPDEAHINVLVPKRNEPHAKKSE